MGWTRAHVLLLPTMLITLAGCETISQDFTDLSESLSTPSPLEAAEMMFDKYNADNRRRGTVLLANSDFGGAPPYVEAYRQMVEDETNPLVLAVAVRALARHGDVSDAAAIAGHLEHENRQVRWEAAKGLQRLHDPSVVTNLLTVLGEPAEDSDVRIASATALAQYPEDRVFQGLVQALSSRELAVNVTAENALTALTAQSFDGIPAHWLAWYDAQVASGSDPFQAAVDYRYPTYSRNEAWWEQLAFWTQPIREQPGIPAGLTQDQQRTTWDDESPSGDDSSDQGASGS